MAKLEKQLLIINKSLHNGEEPNRPKHQKELEDINEWTLGKFDRSFVITAES